MMSKEEAIDNFNKLEHDIVLLQKILAMKNDVIDLIGTDNIEKQNKIQNVYDELADQLQIVELF